MIRAKFKVNSVNRSLSSFYVPGLNTYESREVQSITLSPVSGGPDASAENNAFWASTPSGQIQLSVISADVGNQFTLAGEFYVDFTPAK